MNFDIDLSKIFFEFLESNNSTLYMKQDDKFYSIIKLSYSSSLDLIFGMYCYSDKISIEEKLEYCGFYDKINKQLYDPQYLIKNRILNLAWDDKTYPSMSDLLEQFRSDVNKAIDSYVNSEKEDFCKSVDKYEPNLEEHNVYRDFLEGKEKFTFEADYDSNNKTNVLNYIYRGQDYVNEIAFNYVTVEKEQIGKQLISIDKKNELLEQIISDKKHSIHKVKAIIDSVKNQECSTVHIFINKNDIDCDFRYDAKVLGSPWSLSCLSTFNITTPDRYHYEKLFGKYIDFQYEDITKIEYRGKAIYEDLDLTKKIANEKEALVI